MKIYDRREFISGALMVGLSVINLLVFMVEGAMEWSVGILIGFLFLFGLSTILRSMSKTLSQEVRSPKQEQLEQKALSRSFRLTQIISFLLLLVVMLIGMLSDVEAFVIMGAGLALAFAVSLFIEFFTYIYYASRN